MVCTFSNDKVSNVFFLRFFSKFDKRCVRDRDRDRERSREMGELVFKTLICIISSCNDLFKSKVAMIDHLVKQLTDV